MNVVRWELYGAGREWGENGILYSLGKIIFISCELSTYRIYLVPGAGIEPAQPRGPRDFKSLASTNFATPAPSWIIGHGPHPVNAAPEG